MVTSSIPIKIVLGMVAASHLIIGLIGGVPGIPTDIVVRFYGAGLTVTPQIEHIIQMFGAYMFTVGVLGALTFRDPVRYRSVVLVISFLLFIRVLQRILFAGEAAEVFDISPLFYWVQTVAYLAMGLALVLLRPKASEPANV